MQLLFKVHSLVKTLPDCLLARRASVVQYLIRRGDKSGFLPSPASPRTHERIKRGPVVFSRASCAGEGATFVGRLNPRRMPAGS